jgi:hypothetical protein
MSKISFIYIIPKFAGIIGQMGPDTTKWEMINNGDYSPKSDPIRQYYDEYKRIISESSGSWTIIFKRYKKINAVVFIIKKIKEDSSPASWKDSDMIFSKYRRECDVKSIGFNKNYTLEIVENDEGSIDSESTHDTLYLERHDKNELRRKDILNYEMMTNYDAKLAKTIEDDVITLLCVSILAFYYTSHLLEEHTTENHQDIIKAFWGYKSHLLRCQGAQVFPIFFKDKMSIVDNLLDYRTMDLTDKQIKAIEDIGLLLDNTNDSIKQQRTSLSNQELTLGNINQMITCLDKTVANLANLLSNIHLADNGILFLTFLIAFEIVSKLIGIEPAISKEFIALAISYIVVCFLIYRFVLRKHQN